MLNEREHEWVELLNGRNRSHDWGGTTPIVVVVKTGRYEVAGTLVAGYAITIVCTPVLPGVCTLL